MNRLFIILCSQWLITSCQTKSDNFTKPKIQFEKDTFQLGRITIGDSITVQLLIKNIGKENLNITNIGYGCGCTKGKIQKNTLVESESTSFEFTYKNEVDIDVIDKTIIFETNSSEPFKVLKIIGQGASKNR